LRSRKSPKTEEKEESKEKAMSIEIPDKQEIKDISYSTDDKIEDTQKEAEQATTFSEAELTTRDELALDAYFLKIIIKNIIPLKKIYRQQFK
ncbi:12825_t:CDS:1, partial [Racocetra persica]